MCHQDLTEDASARLKRFDEFMDDTLQQEAEKAKEAFEDSKKAISSLPDLNEENIKQQLQPYANLTDANKQHSENIVSDVRLSSSRLTAIKTIIENDNFGDLESIRNEGFSLQADINAAISEIDAEITQLESLIQQGTTGLSTEDQSRLNELESKSLCNSQKNNIDSYYQKSQRIALLKACNSKLNTQTISNQSRNRSAALYSDKLKRRYSSEVGKLGLSYLNIEVGNKADRGEQRVFVNVTGLKQTKKSEILSEGEQRAIALAGFLTEVNEVDTGHAIIFDDPVSSLDLERKNQIAKRLVEEAKNRQVIIFTHDHSFLLALKHHSETKSVCLKNQWICKKENQWGITGANAVAWQIKPIDTRINEIQDNIDRLQSNIDSGTISPTAEAFNKDASAIAIELRKLWEASVEQIVFRKVIQRYAPEIKTLRLSEVRFDGGSEDYAKFHEGFSGVVNETPHETVELTPRLLTIDEIRENLDKFREWKQLIRDKRPKEGEALEHQKEANRLGE